MRGKAKSVLKSITAEILENLFFAIENIGAAGLSKKEAYKILYQGKVIGSDFSETKFGRWLESLQQSAYIRITGSKGNRSIEFTNKGKLKIIDAVSKTIDTDGKYRFVSFDIPEEFRLSRDKFRNSIKKLGFIQIQKSLWVINKNVAELVEIASYQYGVEKYVVYLVSEKSDIDGIIAKKLKEVKR